MSGTDALAVSALVSFVALILGAYFIDRAGWPFEPAVMLGITLTGPILVLSILRDRITWDATEAGIFVTLVAGTFGWLMWIARPAFLPLGSGPDLTHHLLLIQYIERHWRLVHADGVEPFLGEMVHYTPGSHMLVALAGAWTGSNGLHAMHAVTAATVALKAGFVFLIALRVMPREAERVPLATLAVVTLFAAQTYFLRSFTDKAFLAQVVAEFLAVGMWWALTAWNEEPGPGLALLVGVTGAAVFLTWPVWIGPLVMVLVVLGLIQPKQTRAGRAAHLLLMLGPIAITVALYIAGREAWLLLVGTGGQAPQPEPAAYGWWFLAPSTAGLVMYATRREARVTVLLTAGILLQAAALYALASYTGASAPYMMQKMFYLLLYPQAVGVALAVALAWRWLPARVGRPIFTHSRVSTAVAWLVVALVAVRVARPLSAAPRSLATARHPATSIPLEQAGEWARTHVPTGCVEYLVDDDDTAYWLHLAVLGNPRMSSRTGDTETYEPIPTIVRWLTPGGMPYAIADLSTLPADVTRDLDIVARFDTAAVARRRGPSTCPEVR